MLDMFAGGGAIPLEAARLGCDATAVELNPVAHLIERCMLEYPQRFGTSLADDIRTWGERWVGRAWERVGHLYPPAHETREDDSSIWQLGRLTRRSASSWQANRLSVDKDSGVPEPGDESPRGRARTPNLARQEEGTLHRTTASCGSRCPAA